jgi:4-carboxymuconolactone decarboxylase
MIKQDAGRKSLGDFAPAFAHYNDDILFGENWNDSGIDIKTRCIVTLSSLISQGITDTSLQYHISNAKKNGVSQSEFAAIVTHIAFYAGWPKAWAAFNIGKKIYTEEQK